MKKNIFQLFATAFLALIAFSCEDDRNNEMVNDKVGLLNPDYTTVNVYKGDETLYSLYVIKSGKGLQGGEVSLSVSESVLNDYNAEKGTSYQMLPANCYSIVNSHLSFDDSDYRKSFEIKWNQAELFSLQGTNYVIPVQMKVENTSIEAATDRMTAIIAPTVMSPYLGFANPGLYSPSFMPTIDDLDEREIYVKVVTNYNSRLDLNYQIEYDPQLIEDYNATYGKKFKMIPEGSFELEKKSLTILKNQNEGYVKILFHKKGLIPEANTYLFGDYIIPIRIKEVSNFGIDPNAASILYPVSFQPDKIVKTTWKVLDYNSCINQEPQYAALAWGPEKLLDNDLNTFWGSKWDVPKPFPYYFVFDMGQEHTIFRMGYENPTGANAWRGNAKAGYVEVSSDNVTYTKLSDWQVAATADRTLTFDVPATKARYIRFVITSAFSLDANGGARINISEINTWGL